MEHETRWTVDIDIHEYDDRTRAEARLSTGAGTERTGTGTARKHPHDANVPAIGDELAVARAMADLSHQLIEATAADIEAVTRRPAHLTE